MSYCILPYGTLKIQYIIFGYFFNVYTSIWCVFWYESWVISCLYVSGLCFGIGNIYQGIHVRMVSWVIFMSKSGLVGFGTRKKKKVVDELFHVCIWLVFWHGENNGQKSCFMSTSGLCFATYGKKLVGGATSCLNPVCVLVWAKKMVSWFISCLSTSGLCSGMGSKWLFELFHVCL